MKFTDKWIIFLATGFYSGKAPFAPGTFGTGVGLIFCFILSKANTLLMAFSCFFVIFLSIIIAGKAESLLEIQDPGEIVIDEIAGIIITLAGIPFTFLSVTVGFFLFRFLDILKPFPIRNIEKKLSGGVGIVMDDIVAGVMANIVLRIIFF